MRIGVKTITTDAWHPAQAAQDLQAFPQFEISDFAARREGGLCFTQPKPFPRCAHGLVVIHLNRIHLAHLRPPRKAGNKPRFATSSWIQSQK